MLGYAAVIGAAVNLVGYYAEKPTSVAAMTTAAELAKHYPNAFFLDAAAPDAVEAYLHRHGWIDSDVQVSALSKAGEGNMNLVLRAQLSDGRNVIIKQSRPWVEKFPSIAAPAERANVEALYYEKTAALDAIAACSPKLLQADPESHILLLEDLGDGADLSHLYAGDTELAGDTLAALTGYLSALHHNFRRNTCDFLIENAEMRALNAEHIFNYPFAAHDDFDLDQITPGLAAVSASVRSNAPLMARIDALHQRYLRNGDTLVHGDFFPGSFLQSGDAVKVIDAEFCFFGDPEFDVGVLLAHLMMAQQPGSVTDSLLASYEAPTGFSEALCQQYAGVEVLRRLLGLAQLPVNLDLAQKTALVERASQMLMAGEEAGVRCA